MCACCMWASPTLRNSYAAMRPRRSRVTWRGSATSFSSRRRRPTSGATVQRRCPLSGRRRDGADPSQERSPGASGASRGLPLQGCVRHRLRSHHEERKARTRIKAKTILQPCLSAWSVVIIMAYGRSITDQSQRLQFCRSHSCAHNLYALKPFVLRLYGVWRVS